MQEISAQAWAKMDRWPTVVHAAGLSSLHDTNVVQGKGKMLYNLGHLG